MDGTGERFFENITLVKENISYESFASKFNDVLVSTETLSVFATVVDLWMSLLVAMLGVVTNILTLAVFFAMGFRDSVNITMTTIAFWDLVRSLCGTLYRLHGPIAWFSPSLARAWQNITVTNVVYLNIISGNVSYVMAGYVALERCLCVSLPFKVRFLVTPRVAFSACLSLSALVFITLFPIMLTLEYKWVDTGQSGGPVVIYQFTYFYKVYGQSFMDVYKYLSLVYPIVSLTVMVICTAVITYHLRESSRFRKDVFGSQSGAGNVDPKAIAKEAQIVKMLLVIILSYIVVLVPRVVHYVVEIFEPEYYLLKYYNNIFWLVVYFIFLMDFINSTAGFFIFYSMGSKFRNVFMQMFLRRKPCCTFNAPALSPKQPNTN